MSRGRGCLFTSDPNRSRLSSGRSLFGEDPNNEPPTPQTQTMNKTQLNAKGALVNDVPEGRTTFGAKIREAMLAGSAKTQAQAITLVARTDGDAFNKWNRDGRPAIA